MEKLINRFFYRPEIERDYGFLKDGVYKRNHRSEGLFKDAEYLKWDKCHNEVEVYNKRERHLGAYDPVSNKMYKPAKPERKLFD